MVGIALSKVPVCNGVHAALGYVEERLFSKKTPNVPAY